MDWRGAAMFNLGELVISRFYKSGEGSQSWGSGFHQFRSAGVLEYWSIGVLEYWSVGALEYWSTGVLEYWSIGVLECWSIGVLEYMCQINSILISGELTCRFVLVLVLVLEASEPLSIEDEDEYEDEHDLRLKDSRSDQRKETNERRTSNVQHRTSNKVFCLF